MSHRLIVATCLIVSVSASSPASAQSDGDRATARALADEAQTALEAKEFARAEELFDRAAALVRAPTLQLGRARSLVGMGRLVAAHEAYQRIVRDGTPPEASPAFTRAVDDARAELAALAGRLPSVVLRIQGPTPTSTEVEVDGERIPSASLGAPRFIDPGSHAVRASAEGFAPVEATFVVRAGDRAELPLTLRAQDISAPSPLAPTTPVAGATDAPTSGWLIAGLVTGGVGVVGLGVAAVTGGMYLGAQADVDDHCDARGRCDPEGLDAAQRGETLGVVNTVALFGGLAALGGGVALVVWSSSTDASTSTAVAPPRPDWRARSWATPLGAGLVTEGSF